jgi:DNA mismatch repair protein MutL
MRFVRAAFPRPPAWDGGGLGLAAIAIRARAKAALRTGLAEAAQSVFDVGAPSADVRGHDAPLADLIDSPLGAARTQIHDTYIVSQTRDGLSSSISTPRMSASSMSG